ncbi:MAG: InlB B-repeat-containing protein, partial [Clostridiales bacterium]|nr:InlB B-repeat-containing protein [Clostridiales bacterium]
MKKKLTLTLLCLVCTMTAILGFAACDWWTENKTPTTPAHTHSYGKWETITPATCTQEGVRRQTCECGDYKDQSIPKTNHTVVIDEAVAATCKKTGLTQGSHCSECGTTIVAQTTTNKLDHTYGAWQQTKASSCKDYGTERRDCGNCDAYETRNVEKIAHTEGAWIVDEEATCQKKGSRHTECSVCHTIIKTGMIDKTAHTEVIDEAVAPAFGISGLTQGSHCSVCNTVIIAQQVVEYDGLRIKNFEGYQLEYTDKDSVPRLYKEVDNDVINYDLSVDFVLSSATATWDLYSDIGCNTVLSQLRIMTNLKLGKNIAYVGVSDSSTSDFICYEVTLYRLDIKSYTFISDGVTYASGTIQEHDDLTAPQAPEKDLHTFMGWALQENGEVLTFPYYIETNTTFYAVLPKTHTRVSFDPNSGECESTTAVYEIGKTYSFPVGSKVGYTFVGWYLNGEKITDELWQITTECTLTAQWVANTNTLYTVKHIGQNITNDEFGTEILIEELHGTSDSEVIPDIKSFTGFTAPQTQELTVAADGSAVLTYYYTRNSYQLTLVKNDGTTSDHTVKYEAQIPTVSRQGFTLGGWFSNEALTQSVTSMPANEITLYAWWQEENKAGDFKYVIENTATITSYLGASSTVKIPTYIGGVAVTTIAPNAFYVCNSLTSVAIGDSVTSIGNYAFYDCSSLTSVTIGDSVTSIGSDAFYDCNIRQTERIGDSVTWVAG